MPLVDGWVLAGTARLPRLAAGAQAGYRIEADAAWRVRAVSVRPAGWAGGDRVDLVRDPSGAWRVGPSPRPDLDGCVDVWLGFTPAGLTPLVRRLDLSAGARASADVVVLDDVSLGVGRGTVEVAREDADTYQVTLGDLAAAIHIGPQGLVTEFEDAWKAIAHG